MDLWNPEKYSSEASYVFTSVSSLIQTLNPHAGERILDLGCGPGELSLVIRDSGCELVAVDSSPAMVKKAQEKGLDARVMDGHDMSFVEEFDAVFSNAALHWMREDPDIRESLKPNGRFVAEFGGKGNIQSILEAISCVFQRHGRDAKHPWYFPSVEEYSQLLRSNDFQVKEAFQFRKDIPCPTGPVGWLEVFGGEYFRDMSEEEKIQYMEDIAAEMEPLTVNEEGTLLMDYERLRIHAIRI